MSTKNKGGFNSPLFVFASDGNYLVYQFDPIEFKGELYQNERVTRIIGELHLSHPYKEKTDSFLKKTIIQHGPDDLFEATKKYSFVKEDFIHTFIITPNKRDVVQTEKTIAKFIEWRKIKYL